MIDWEARRNEYLSDSYVPRSIPPTHCQNCGDKLPANQVGKVDECDECYMKAEGPE